MYRRQHIIVGIDIPQLLSVLRVCLSVLMPLPFIFQVFSGLGQKIEFFLSLLPCYLIFPNASTPNRFLCPDFMSRMTITPMPGQGNPVSPNS
jgi:hypothetical protein